MNERTIPFPLMSLCYSDYDALPFFVVLYFGIAEGILYNPQDDFSSFF
jgi:hypothetical protein